MSDKRCGLCDLWSSSPIGQGKKFSAADVIAMIVGGYWLGESNAELCHHHASILHQADAEAARAIGEVEGVH